MEEVVEKKQKEKSIKNKLQNKFKYFLYLLFFLVFIWTNIQLFFPEITKNIFNETNKSQNSRETKMENFKIIYPDEPTSLEPTLIDTTTRQRTINIYEPLIKTDKDLIPKTALAISWGLIDDTTWEIILRPNVKFHNGSNFKTNDAIASIERAKNNPESQLKEILETIIKMEIIDNKSFRIKTSVPDPLLLQKLSMVLITPEKNDKDIRENPIGTGPYKFESWKKKEKIELTSFKDHWKSPGKFEKVSILSIPDKSARVEAFVKKEADFLAFVPYEAAEIVQNLGFTIKEIPNLEVQSLIFNTKSEYLNSPEERKTILYSIDKTELAKNIGKFAKPINQFVSNGIFGYNTKIKKTSYNPEKAKEMAKKYDLENKTIQIHLPIGLEILGEHIRKELKTIKINPIISYMQIPELLKSMQQKLADIYFIAYKSDLGDSGDFFNLIVHSKGSYNIANYSNPITDQEIDDSFKELDTAARQQQLQNLMEKIVEEEVIGVPLFEYETVFSLSEKLDTDTRIDGLIYFDDIITK